MLQSESTRQIKDLNDAFRTTLTGGTIVLTAAVKHLPEAVQSEIIEAVRVFDSFTLDNDPYGEHDFGAFTCQGHRLFWKIDYYDTDWTYQSENPADPQLTRRALTIMLAEEY